VLLIDLAEYKTSAVYVDHNRQLGRRWLLLKAREWYIELEDGAFQFVGCGGEALSRKITTSHYVGSKDLWTCVTGKVSIHDQHERKLNNEVLTHVQ